MVKIREPMSEGKKNIIAALLQEYDIQTADFTLEELGWTLYPIGNMNGWNGLNNWFIDFIDKHNILLNDKYISEWYRAAAKNMS